MIWIDSQIKWIISHLSRTFSTHVLLDRYSNVNKPLFNSCLHPNIFIIKSKLLLKMYFLYWHGTPLTFIWAYINIISLLLNTYWVQIEYFIYGFKFILIFTTISSNRFKVLLMTQILRNDKIISRCWEYRINMPHSHLWGLKPKAGLCLTSECSNCVKV